MKFLTAVGSQQKERKKKVKKCCTFWSTVINSSFLRGKREIRRKDNLWILGEDLDKQT